PGVTVMWLAALAFGPERSAELAARAGDLTQLEKSPTYLGALFDARRALALVSAGLIVLLALLTWRLYGAGPGLLAGLLLASEPGSRTDLAGHVGGSHRHARPHGARGPWRRRESAPLGELLPRPGDQAGRRPAFLPGGHPAAAQPDHPGRAVTAGPLVGCSA